MQEILQSYYHYSDDNNKVFKIIKQPTKGKIIKEKYLIEQNEFINEFFDDELKRNEVFYSTENSHKVKGRDKFIIRICSTSNKKCELDLEFAIFISSLDVKIPEVLKNERLIVWSNNEPFTITNKHLFVHDEDTPPKDIIFSIAKVINGFVSLSTDILKPIKYFTQDDINSNLIQFTLTQDSTGGFSFTVSDDVDRIEAEWFTVEKVIKNSIVFENNARLFTYPSGREYITVNLLKVAYLNASNNDIIYHISKQPKHGNILLNGQKTNLFTQLDLINKNVIFESTNKYQKHWIVKDYFLFNMSVNGKIFSEVEKFRIAITYALIQQDKQNMFIPTSKMYVSTSGSSILTQSFLNITQIVKYLSKEKLILEIWKPPRFGRIKFFKGSLKSDKIIGDEIFFLDKYIYYENDQKNQKVDDTWFSLCPEKECHKRGSKMKIHLPIEIILPKIKEIKFENFEDLIYINETGIKILNSQNIKVTHTFLSSSNLYFTVNKSSKNTTNIFVDDKRSTTFSQKDIENGIVTLRKSRKFTESFDLLQINIGGHNRVLKVLYQSTEIKFLNQSNIEYYQGKTYVLLNQTHFNVKNLANRENIIYNVTKTPKNGTFYRVDGDKEALTFSQKNIDNGEILYAQVNMNAFQDYFEFSIIYDGNEILKSNSRITIIPTIDYKPFTLEGGTMSNIDINYINASMLSELSPKFYVVSNPLYGKLILNGITPMNESVRFFTFNDILEHRLFYDAYDSKKNIVDNIQIELKGDSIQPARFNFTVNITPTLINSYQKNLNTTKKPHVTETTNSKPLIPKIQSDTDTSNFSVMIAACVIVVIFCIIFCRKSPLKKDESQPQTYQLNVDQNPNFYRSLEALQLSKQIANKNMAPNKVPSTNLLENTVYAKIVEQRLDSTTLSPKVVRKGTTQFELPNEPKKVKILQTFDPTKETSKNDVSNSPYVSFLPKEAVKIHKTNSENNSNSRKLSGNTTLKKDQYWV
uniref:Chondroitin sulfate proteoglycan 4 (inferred by orthology to a human protein) n=1 Tax=Strongyloides venezuelensis TaxID=75913 RepID=A0A0K0F8I9_STRVS